MEFREGHTVGIDLGTTFSTIAQLDENGNPVALPNEEEEEETPSLVLLTDSHHVVVGPNRMRAAMEDPDHVVERIKRRMGDADYHRTFDGREITPEFLSALILKKLRQDGEKRIGKITNAVITVPYYFNDVRRKATEDAGRIAGLNVIDIINEPTAATLMYAWQNGEFGTVGLENEKPRLVLVFDLGGGTFDVTVVRYTPTHFQVLATDGDVQLGGVDWDDRILDYVADEFKARHGSDPRDSRQAVHTLGSDCDTAKLDLSEQEEVKLRVRYEGRAISVTITREMFETITADLLQRTADTTELVLEQAGVSAGQLDAVVLVGGGTLMPQVPRMLRTLLDREPYTGLSPYTAVAQGAAIHAAILEAKYRGEGSELATKLRKKLESVKQENVNSHGLGVVAVDPRSGQEVNHVMIRRNTALPVEVSQMFRTRKENQQRVSIQVLEGDAPDPLACSLLGKCRIENLPADLPKGSSIEVTYAFNASGRISVKARDQTGGRQAAIAIDRSGGLDEQQVDALRKLAEAYQVD